MQRHLHCGELPQVNFVWRIRCFETTGPFIRMAIVCVADCAMFLLLLFVYVIAFAQAGRADSGVDGWVCAAGCGSTVVEVEPCQITS